MTLIRRFILAAVLMAGFAPAIAQVPAPVPALPDTERRTSYSITASTCACNVNFALFGDSTDFQNWVEVFINGVRYDYNDASHGWTITTPSGSLASLARPITNAVLTFNAVQTGVVQIVGARRPRRASQFNENAGVSARNLNQVFTDIISQNREIWDKTNDMTGRGLFSQPGVSMGLLPLPSSCPSAFLGFDATGLIPTCRSSSGTGNVTLPVVNNHFICADGTAGLLKDCGSSGALTGLTIGTAQMTGLNNIWGLTGSGNSNTTALHLGPGPGTLPTGVITELVLGQTDSQAFGGNYGRISLSTFGSVGSFRTGIIMEYGGTTAVSAMGDFLIQNGIENPPGTFTNQFFLQLYTKNGGSEASQAATIGLGSGDSVPLNKLHFNMAPPSSAGRTDSHSILFESAWNSGAGTGATWWRQTNNLTSNAGASQFIWQSNLNGAGWNTRASLTDAGLFTAASFAGALNGTVGATTPAAGTFTTATANSFIPNSSTIPTNGIYLPAANTLGWAINSAAELQLTSTALSPAVDGGNSLGTTALGWQNLFANTGFVLNIEGGDWVATHTAGILTVGTGDLRVTTAGTNSASAVTVGGTQALIGKTYALSGATIVTNGMYLPTTNTVGFAANSLDVLRLLPTASAVNYAYIKGSAAGGGGARVTYAVDGSDTDIGIDFIAKGAGTVNFSARGSNAGGIMRLSSGTGAAANGFNLTSTGTGVGPDIAATDLGGTGDSNIDITLTPKGTGKVAASNDIKTGAVAVASLPTCNAARKAARYFVTDSNAASYTAGIGAIVAAGGATNAPVVCDGTNWRIGANDNVPTHLIRKFA